MNDSWFAAMWCVKYLSGYRYVERDFCLIMVDWICRHKYATGALIVAAPRHVLRRKLKRLVKDPDMVINTTARTLYIAPIAPGMYTLTEKGRALLKEKRQFSKLIGSTGVYYATANVEEANRQGPNGGRNLKEVKKWKNVMGRKKRLLK